MQTGAFHHLAHSVPGKIETCCVSGPSPPLHRGFPTFLVGFSLRDCNVVSIVPLWSTTRNQPMHVQFLPVNGKYEHIFENLIDQPV